MNDNENILYLKLLALKNLEELKVDTILSSRIVKGLNEKEVKNIINFCVEAAKRKKSIRGVYFYAATRYGRFMIENGSMSVEELYKLIKNATKGAANIEYFIESKKFILLLHQILEKFKMFLPFGGGGFIAPFSVGSIKKFIPLKNLKRINQFLEKRQYFKALKCILRENKMKELIKDILKVMVKRKPIENSILTSGILIGFGGVNTPISFDVHSFEAPEIFKKKSLFFVRSFTYGAKYEQY
jgi:uncharacterized radical SAM superfamily Fe-S cluster-containing enzyme